MRIGYWTQGPWRYFVPMSAPKQPARRNPWWAVLLLYVFGGGFLALVAARLLPGQDPDQQDPDF